MCLSNLQPGNQIVSLKNRKTKERSGFKMNNRMINKKFINQKSIPMFNEGEKKWEEKVKATHSLHNSIGVSPA